MTITAQVIADSVSPDGIRLTTFQLRYPKFIHGEFMTHRVFSRNASSSRAIPVERLIQDIVDDPAAPIFWGRNQPGMQSREELTGIERHLAEITWDEARLEAIKNARMMNNAGAHKQIVNRIIEPWCHINVVVTATEWDNFFALRCHADAQPEMRVLAEAIRDARDGSTPILLAPPFWHLPYVAPVEQNRPKSMMVQELIKLSVARCARVSYLTHEGKPPDVDADLKLYDRLVSAVPLHASPAEHQATPDERGHLTGNWYHSSEHANFRGWRQYRKMLPGECQ